MTRYADDRAVLQDADSAFQGDLLALGSLPLVWDV
jgi:hypothetical protein